MRWFKQLLGNFGLQTKLVLNQVNFQCLMFSQTSSFSCATVALMNVINNRQDLQLGEQLEQFRTFTAKLSSKDRGLALDAFDHVRNVHNSFAA